MKSDDHLQRLRTRLTTVFAITMALGLLGFGVFLLRSYLDAQSQETATDLLLSANKAASAVAYDDDDNVDVSGYYEQGLQDGYPQMWIVGWDESTESGYTVLAGPTENYWDVDLLQGLDPVIEGTDVYMYSLWSNEKSAIGAYVRGVPITYSDGYSGHAAAIAVTDPDSVRWGYENFRVRVIMAGLGLLLVSALVGYWVAGKSMIPAKESLEQQERLIADAAHELRTPVARIRAVAEGGLAGDEPSGEALQRVVNVASSASGLVDDLLVLARMDAGSEELKTEPFRLDLLVEAEADLYEDIDVETVATTLNGDPNLIRRAVGNLIANAIKHGRLDDPDSPITVTVFPTRVRVSDEGPGIDPELGDQLFERFQSGSASSGHGLGLAIVKWVTQAHGGVVSVEPAEHGGTTATMEFPSS